MGKNSLFKYILVVFLAFLYFFPLHLKFLPGFLNTRLVLFCIGFALISLDGETRRRFVDCFRKLGSYSGYVIVIFLISLFISFAQGVFEKQFLVYPLNYIISIISSFFVCYCIFKASGNNITREKIIDVYTGVIVLECLLSMALFFIPSFNGLIYSIIELEGLEAEAVNRVLDASFGNRFLGVGVTFFGAGIAFALCLFLIFIRFLSETSVLQKVLYIASFIFILFVGSGISRTTQIGAFLGLAYFILIKIKESKGRIIRTKAIVVTLGIILLVSATFTFYQKRLENNVLVEAVFKHAFEGFYNLFEEGKFYTHSSDESLENYIWPNDISTWVLGDGRLMADDKMYYYMDIDVGWCRLVFYFGIIGTLIFVLSQLVLFRKMDLPKYGHLFVFILLCLFLSKGLTDLMAYVMPFVLINEKIKKKRRICVQ